jgi:hypothetical protein
MIQLTDRYTLFISFDGLTGPLERGKIVPYIKGIAQHG